MTARHDRSLSRWPSRRYSCMTLSERGRMSIDGWAEASAEILAGITHAMGTRVSTVSSIAQFMQSGDIDLVPMGDLLAGESVRLEELLDALRLLSAPEGQGEQPFTLHDFLAETSRVLCYHPRFRGGLPALVANQMIPPVIADVDGLRRAMIVALLELGREGGAMTMHAAAEDDSVTLSVFTDGACALEREGAIRSCLGVLATRAGAELLDSPLVSLRLRAMSARRPVS